MVSSMQCKAPHNKWQYKRMLPMQVCSPEDKQVEDLGIVPSIGTNVVNAMVGVIGHISVLPVVEEDVPKCEEDEEDVDEDVVEVTMLNRYRLM